MPNRCWCGQTDLHPFSDDYSRCPSCDTLVVRRDVSAAIGRVTDDAADFYGTDYWFGHQAELGFENIHERARRDLPERCLHWLRTLMRYVPPPATVLELGSSHGAFVALMSRAGYNATGLELSPSIVEFARQTFGVSVLQGPIEDQALARDSIDVIAAMDVLEHLADPLATIRRCAALLRHGGAFVLQTPCYPEGTTLAELEVAHPAFLGMLQPREHIFLFSRTAVARLLAECGIHHVSFEPARFASDMFLIASREPSAPLDMDAALRRIPDNVGGRLANALLDMDAERTTLNVQLQQALKDAADRLHNISVLEGLLHDSERDRAARLTHMQQYERMVNDLQQELSSARRQLESLRTGPVSAVRNRPERGDVPFVAIDVTPILPGSENGGAKGLVLDLLDGFAAARRHRYLLLTSSRNHEYFAPYDAKGMSRLCIDAGTGSARPFGGRVRRVLRRVRRWAHGPLRNRHVDLLLSVMTDPARAEPGIPVVSIVYDLQHCAYPSFFTPAERSHRDAFFERVRRGADAIVCISEFTRLQVIDRLLVDPERVRAIPIAIHDRLPHVAEQAVAEVRTRFRLGDDPFALYPANAWPHKNHRLLFVAFARLLRERPEMPLHLVCVGNLFDAEHGFKEEVAAMGLAARVHLPGFVDDHTLAALWRGAHCLVYPSLYEGFGIPVLEAMYYGVPVICSKVASLPEIAGDAARYVDPTSPAEIVSALAEIVDDPALARDLVSRGHQRIGGFSREHMIEQYLSVIDDTLTQRGSPITRVHGVFADRWVGPEITALTGPSTGIRSWQFEIHVPEHHPHRDVTVRVEVQGGGSSTERVARGETRTLTARAPAKGGAVWVRSSPSFMPPDDPRELAVQLVSGRLREGSGEILYEF